MNGEIQKSCPRTCTVLYVVERKNGWKGKELEILLRDGRALEKNKLGWKHMRKEYFERY
jgi:hypothetical protein